MIKFYEIALVLALVLKTVTFSFHLSSSYKHSSQPERPGGLVNGAGSAHPTQAVCGASLATKQLCDSKLVITHL